MKSDSKSRPPRGLSTKTPAALHRSLQRIANMAFRGEMDPALLRSLTYCLGLIQRVIESNDLEKRIEQLEQKLERKETKKC